MSSDSSLYKRGVDIVESSGFILFYASLLSSTAPNHPQSIPITRTYRVLANEHQLQDVIFKPR